MPVSQEHFLYTFEKELPSRVALSVAHRSADRRVAGSSPGRNASCRCTRSATLWAQGIGDWELFSHGISARASMWDMQEASGRYLITGLRVWKPRSKQNKKLQKSLLHSCAYSGKKSKSKSLKYQFAYLFQPNMVWCEY